MWKGDEGSQVESMSFCNSLQESNEPVRRSSPATNEYLHNLAGPQIEGISWKYDGYAPSEEMS